ncbi:hypothetical protein LR48_Vigan10g170400 [Vigna angularis]|uniref:Uncharacterized protein n=1 Tax=Phaseolus angularis TaxID=3914 RepID=A0A0L9VLM6_PHAAN|nr:hypothetical protein LR48_Vigan10g170400 [Vigna angularis]
MASSSHPSRDRGKAIVAPRNADLSGWICDEETRLEFMSNKRSGVIDAGTKHARHLPYAVFISKILTLQGVDVSGERIALDEDNMVQSSRSTPALNEDNTNFVPETNFERFVVEKLRRLEQNIDTLHEKKNKMILQVKSLVRRIQWKYSELE